jgi:hypothetical protein
MKESFQTSFKFLHIIWYIFNVGWEIIKNSNTHIMYPSLVYSKISYGLIKVIYGSCLVFLVWFSEFKISNCLLLTTKSISKSIYCDVRDKISNLSNRLQHETLFLWPVMILIILFCSLNNFVLWGELPQKGRPYVRIALK